MRKVVDLGKQIWLPILASFAVLGGIATVFGVIYGTTSWVGNIEQHDLFTKSFTRDKRPATTWSAS